MQKLYGGLLVGLPAVFLTWFVWMLIGIPESDVLVTVFTLCFIYGAIKGPDALGYSAVPEIRRCEYCKFELPGIVVVRSRTFKQVFNQTYNCPSCGKNIDRFGRKRG